MSRLPCVIGPTTLQRIWLPRWQDSKGVSPAVYSAVRAGGFPSCRARTVRIKGLPDLRLRHQAHRSIRVQEREHGQLVMLVSYEASGSGPQVRHPVGGNGGVRRDGRLLCGLPLRSPAAVSGPTPHRSAMPSTGATPGTCGRRGARCRLSARGLRRRQSSFLTYTSSDRRASKIW